MEQNIVKNILRASVLGLLVATTACTTAPKSSEDRALIQDKASNTVSTAKKSDPTLGAFLDKAAGYAVFPTVGKGAVGVGGAYGKGTLYEHGAFVGYCDLSQATIGLALGGQAYSEIIAFETPAAVEKFKRSEFAFSAQATAVALKSGAGANAKYADGVAVFTMAESGLMAEASIGGQKFAFEPK